MRAPRSDRPRAPHLVLTGVLAVLALTTSACAEVVALRGPDIGQARRHPPEQSLVYDAAGNRIGVLRQQFRDRVELDAIPEQLVDAVVAVEDRRFWQHEGVDVRSIARAAVRNLADGEIVQGGSTITQQLVKNLYLPEAARTFRTKAREALLARDLEREMSKREILTDYLNTVYFGSGAYGVQAAAYTYWRKDVQDLTLAQSALLAGLIRAPASLDPHRNPTGVRQRRDHVLQAMRTTGVAPPDAVRAAMAEPVDVAERPAAPASSHPYWLDFVTRTLLDESTFGDDEADRAARLYGGGLRIHTTLDPAMQRRAEAVVERFFDDPGDPSVAIATVDPATGAIRASVGGRDHDKRQFDLATQGRRQPGSTFKTFVLAAALAEGYKPDTPVNGNETVLDYGDGSRDGGRFEVDNYDDVSYGAISLDAALRNSVNAAFARVALDVGIDDVVTTARAAGITSPLGNHPAVALGGLTGGVSPLQMAAGYATLANHGVRVPASPIDRIETADGEVVWRPEQTPRQAIVPAVAWLTTQMLRGVVQDGTGVRAQLPGWEVAGKTGTTTSNADAWFVGYTPTLATAVWMGYPEGNGRPLVDIGGEDVVTGGSWPARLWREFMSEALAGQRPQGFVLPEEAAVEVEIDPDTGLLAAPWCPGQSRTVPRLLAPTETCPKPVTAQPSETELGPEPVPSVAPGPTTTADPRRAPDGRPEAEPPGSAARPSPPQAGPNAGVTPAG